MSHPIDVGAGRATCAVGTALMLMLTLAGCDATKVSHAPDGPQKLLASPTEPPDGLDAAGVTAWNQWQSQEWPNYSYRLSVLCFCRTVMNAPVEVRRSRVITFKGRPLTADQQVTGLGKKPPTINALFVELGEALEDADEVTVEYRSATGVPATIKVDGFTDSLDDETTYSATQVTPTN